MSEWSPIRVTTDHARKRSRYTTECAGCGFTLWATRDLRVWSLHGEEDEMVRMYLDANQSRHDAECNRVRLHRHAWHPSSASIDGPAPTHVVVLAPDWP